MAGIFHPAAKNSKADAPSPPEVAVPLQATPSSETSAADLRRRLLEMIKRNESERRAKKRTIAPR